MLHSRRRPGSTLTFCLLLLFFPGYALKAAGPERIVSTNKDQQRIQDIVDAFVARLPLKQLDFGAGPPVSLHPLTRCPRLVFVLPGAEGAVTLHAQVPRPLPPPRKGHADVLPFRRA